MVSPVPSMPMTRSWVETGRSPAGHTIGGRPSNVIRPTVRHRIGCRDGRADHACR